MMRAWSPGVGSAVALWLAVSGVACGNREASRTSPNVPEAGPTVAAPTASALLASSSTPPTTPGPAASAAIAAIAVETWPPFVAKETSPRKASGKTATFEWSRGLCDMTGTFDTGRFTSAELAATVKLFETEYVPIVGATTTRQALDDELAAAIASVRDLAIVAEPAWEEYRAKKLTSFRQRHQLAVSEIDVRTNPRRLQAHPFYESCRKWGDPLIAGDEATLLASWVSLAHELAAQPGAASSWKGVEAESKRPGAVAKAKADLLAFGWHNCVNKLTVALPFDEAAFATLFRRVKRQCE